MSETPFKDGFETERKFLIEMPAKETLDGIRANGKEYKITQTYLVMKNDGKNAVRRVRKTEKSGETKYFYTEKTDVSFGKRRETEREISKEEYEKYLKEKDGNLWEIDKKRYVFEYENSVFELDVYPFEEKIAVLEIELEDIDEVFAFPPFLKLVKDVTGESGYTNYALAMRKTLLKTEKQ
ncbi:MAG: CYTH domain-containing protein [Clostridia bacterium]|nr:CYTH domain-containing protein [Clostridia bacterium]